MRGASLRDESFATHRTSACVFRSRSTRNARTCRAMPRRHATTSANAWPRPSIQPRARAMRGAPSPAIARRRFRAPGKRRASQTTPRQEKTRARMRRRRTRPPIPRAMRVAMGRAREVRAFSTRERRGASGVRRTTVSRARSVAWAPPARSAHQRARSARRRRASRSVMVARTAVPERPVACRIPASRSAGSRRATEALATTSFVTRALIAPPVELAAPRRSGS